MAAHHPIVPGVEFKDIPGHRAYCAGADGSIWSLRRTAWRKLKGDPRKEDGRLRYTLRRDDGSYRRAYGATLVLEAFVGPCPEGMECCHKDGNCCNDARDNLRWDTSKANKQDMVGHGTRLRGDQINTAKLDAEAVKEIRRIGYPLRQHAARYGVTETLVSLVLRGKVWKHVV